MSSSGRASGGASFSQGTLAARPAPTPNALYFATDTQEWFIANAAGNAWQSIGVTTGGGANALCINGLGMAGAVGVAAIGSGGDLSMRVNAANGNPAAGTEVARIKTADNHFHITRVGSALAVAEGANGKQGTATLAAGTVTVANTSVTASSRIFITPQETGALTGILRVSARVVGTSFTITSSVGTDTAVVAWEIFEPG